MDAFVMLQELLEQEQFELILPDKKACEQQESEENNLENPAAGQKKKQDIRLVYLMNDAVESFLVFHNARMTGEYQPDYEGELIASMSCQDVIKDQKEKTWKEVVEEAGKEHEKETTDNEPAEEKETADNELAEEKMTEYILVVHQGDSVVTIFFEDLLTDVHLYDYGEIGHFWVKDYEYLRQLEYRLAIMRDKLDYLGEEYCTPQEQKLAMLVDFPPLNYCCYPAVPEQYIVPRVEPWVPTQEAVTVMEELAEEAGDEGMLKILKNYRRNPKIYTARRIAAMLHRNAHAKVVDLLDEKLKDAVSVYKKRSFGEDMDQACLKLLHKVEKRQQQLQKEGKRSVILREEPFEIAKDSIGYQMHLMIWEKKLVNRKVKIESYPLQ